MIEFLKEISPSLKYKVLIIQYRSVLEKVHFFKGQQEIINYLLQRIEVMFFEPETTIVRQFDQKNKHIYFTGEGICNLYKAFE